MSKFNQKIADWVTKNNFPDRASVENYVAIHGGKSSDMDDTLDFIFGSKTPFQEQPTSPPEPQEVTPQTLFEELTGVKEPQSLEDIRGVSGAEQNIQRRTTQQERAEIPPEQPTPESVAQRLRRFLSSLFR